MKTFINIMVCALAMAIAVPAANAQKSNRELKKESKVKVQKESRKEAKKLIKDGWQVMPGKLPMDRQIQDAKYAELDTNDKGEKLFFIGTHKAIGGNYSAAKQIADDRARQELAQSVSNEIARKIEGQLANRNYGEGDIEAIDKFVSANKSIVSAQLQGVTPVVEMYREMENGQYEVNVVVKMDADKAMRLAREGLRNELSKQSEALASDLDKILPY